MRVSATATKTPKATFSVTMMTILAVIEPIVSMSTSMVQRVQQVTVRVMMLPLILINLGGKKEFFSINRTFCCKECIKQLQHKTSLGIDVGRPSKSLKET